MKPAIVTTPPRKEAAMRTPSRQSKRLRETGGKEKEAAQTPETTEQEEVELPEKSPSHFAKLLEKRTADFDNDPIMQELIGFNQSGATARSGGERAGSVISPAEQGLLDNLAHATCYLVDRRINFVNDTVVETTGDDGVPKSVQRSQLRGTIMQTTTCRMLFGEQDVPERAEDEIEAETELEQVVDQSEGNDTVMDESDGDHSEEILPSETFLDINAREEDLHNKSLDSITEEEIKTGKDASPNPYSAISPDVSVGDIDDQMAEARSVVAEATGHRWGTSMERTRFLNRSVRRDSLPLVLTLSAER